MRKIVNNVIIPLFFGVLSAVLVIAITIFIVQLIANPALADAWIAVGTLALAFVTSLLAALTWWNIRSNSEKEKRDRTERYLNEIIVWLTGIEGRIFPAGKPIAEEVKETLAEIAAEKTMGDTIAGRFDGLRELDKAVFSISILINEIRNVRYFKEVALGIDNTLCDEINILLEYLQNRQGFITQGSKEELKKQRIDDKELLKLFLVNKTNIERLNLSEKGLLIAQMSINTGDIKEQVNNAISKAVKIKTELLKI